MAVYESVKNCSLPLFKKFEFIDGRECLINYVLLVELDGQFCEFTFNKFECLEKVYFRPPEKNE